MGGAVVRRLQDAGASVYYPRRVEMDLKYPGNLSHYMYELPHKIDTVVHLAARVGGIMAVSANPYGFMHDNLLMGINLVEDCVNYGVSSVIYSNSVCAYPKEAPIPTYEEHYWDGYPESTNAPYGLAKKAVGELLLAARAEHGIKVANLVFANMYGPRDNFSPTSGHVIPALIRRMVEAKQRGDRSVILWGSGKPSRDFLYAGDAARAVVAAGELDHATHLNVASGEECSIYEVACLIRGAVGYKGALEVDPSKPDGQPRRLFNADLFRRLTGWKPEVGLQAGIKNTVAWYVGTIR